MKKLGEINNKGFSLVELVIVMAIIVILGGVAFSGLTLLMSRPVDECAKKMQLALEGNRNTTMGKFSASIEFYTAGDGSIWVREYIDGVSSEKQIGQNAVKVKYKLQGGGEYTLGTTPFVVEFDRASGSLKPGAIGTLKSFTVSRGDRSLTVSIDALTGRVDVE